MAKAKPFNFAHFFGGARAAEEDEEKSRKARKAKKAEDDERKDDAEDDDDNVDAEEDDRKEDAEDDDDDTDAEDDDTDPDAEDDDGDDRKENKASRQARHVERRRCARIFGSKFAVNNVALAASLAFNTGMSSASAIDVLRNISPQQPQGARRRSLDERMQDAEQVRLGHDKAQTSGGKSALVDRMTGLYNSVTNGHSEGGK